MKKLIRLIFIITASFYCAISSADEFYAGIGIGNSNISPKVYEREASNTLFRPMLLLAQDPITTSTVFDNTISTTYIGYTWQKFGLEIGYLDMGQIISSAALISPNDPTLGNLNLNADNSISTKGFYAAATDYKNVLGGKLTLRGKLGIYFWEQTKILNTEINIDGTSPFNGNPILENSVDIIKSSVHGTALFIAGGVGFKFFALDYNIYSIQDTKIGFIILSSQYTF